MEGTYDITASYRFLDSKTSYIAASFDSKRALNRFLEETQEAISKSKASALQVFQLGTRRSKMSTSLNESMRSDDKLTEMKSTTVVMHDASDDMIRMFENDFFPETNEEDVIKRHLEAAVATKAAANPNLKLAKVHEDYVAALMAANELKEVDAMAAAAALSAGDYAGFIAQGVRSINANDRKASHFRRTANSVVEMDRRTHWNQTRNVSVAREVTVPIDRESVSEQQPRHGIVSLRPDIPYAEVTNVFPENGHPPFPSTLHSTGLMLTCIEADSPASRAGLLPGMIVKLVGKNFVQTVVEFETELSTYKPGERISLTVIDGDILGTKFTSRRQYHIDSKMGLPK